MSTTPSMSPSEFIAAVNQTLEFAYAPVMVTGEVASFKINQGKWVFFDLKDEESSISCFMTLWNMRVPLEDGMKVTVRAIPKLTRWGKFSLTVDAIKPVGEGSLKKAYELLKKKLDGEGLFDKAKKRTLPSDLTSLGVISSTGAAGYADFIKIINARWGGINIKVAHTQVQGMDAPDQIMRALQYFNERNEVQVIAILRGGGSADDLSCFNDEQLVRAIAASKIPVITGIGHEVDESLSDLAADVRASTPSNAAELLTHDKHEESKKVQQSVSRATQVVFQKIERARGNNIDVVKRIKNGLISKYIEPVSASVNEKISQLIQKMQHEVQDLMRHISEKRKILDVLNPEKVLRQGYAILSGKISPGNVVKITTYNNEINATIIDIKKRSENVGENEPKSEN